MQRSKLATIARRDAAQEFYGQDEASFEDHLRRLGATDPRLQRAFRNTRERYLKEQGASARKAAN